MYNLKEIWFYLRKRIMFENREEILEKNIQHSRRYFYKKIISNPLRVFKVLTGREINLRYAEVVLTTVCTLNCKGCSALMPLYPRDLKRHIDFEMIAKSIQGLINVVDYVDRLSLLGGETLSYPYLYDVLCLIKSQKKIREVIIITNGTLIIKDERVINLLKDELFEVKISDYGGGYEKLVQQLKKECIKYTIHYQDSWYDFGPVAEKEWKRSELRDNFLYCKKVLTHCYSVLYGKLYMCPRESHGANLGLIPIKQNEYIDLLDETKTPRQKKKQMFSFIYKNTPIEACKYCEGSRKMSHIPVAEQV